MENSDKKVAIYCRVSTQQQRTDRQREDLLKFAENSNLNVEKEFIFVDIISGFKNGEVRPQFSALLEHVEKNHIGTILFSEFSRLARSATELLEQIEYFKKHGVYVYFEKQNLWVKDEKDLSSTMLLHVLAVTASYEIELFAERAISGKIYKVQTGHGGGDERAYGYMNNDRKEIVKNEEEAKIVWQMFTMYANGVSSLRICDWLNENNIRPPYKRRIEEFRENRSNKGLEKKNYKIDVDNLKWRFSTINRILHNELYTGKRHIVFYKPDPTNKLPPKKRKNREILYTYDGYDESLRIVSDELFLQVQRNLLKASYNKNNAIRHDNLLKHLIVCGECGSNFSVGKNESKEISMVNGGRTYKCYGAVKRKDKPKTCSEGVELRMWKFDGLVLQLSLMIFADNDMSKRCEIQIDELNSDILALEKSLKKGQEELELLKSKYKTAIKRLAWENGESDSIIEELIHETKGKYIVESEEIQKRIDRMMKDIVSKKDKISSLKKMGNTTSLYKRMDQIQHDKVLIRSLVDEYIEIIKVYRLCKLWCLIIVQYKDGSEVWGTLKAARYKKEELFYSPDLSKFGVEYQTWVVPNWDRAFTYDTKQKKIYCNGKSQYIENIKEGSYTFEEFDKAIKTNGMMGSFPMYDYENNRFVSGK